ncbi:MAG: phosphoenolpyruvate--protein phosphotransferase [Planctomycetota bacterium]|jgi:phosphotransferase system enzyme I (PtsI)
MTKAIIPDTETIFSGLAVSEGVALGRVCLFNEKRHSNLPIYLVSSQGKDREFNRLENAIKSASAQLDTMIRDIAEKVGPAEAEIFKAQKTILQDTNIKKDMMEIIENNVNAEAAVSRILDFYETRILELDNEYIKERATDIGEIRRRLLDALQDMNPSLQCAGNEHCQRGRDRIIVAVELTPSLTMELDAEHTIGFVTERGGINSHAAILARALGIPAVSGIDKIHSLISCGTEILIDGNTGTLIVWPDDKTLARCPALTSAVKPTVTAVEPVAGLEVMANISLSSQVSEALDTKAEGIGLYRTEFEFIAVNRLLDEDEQFECYASVVKAMNGRPVTFRLLDIGGDKNLPLLNIPKEPNPYLGFRGSRFLLARPDLLRTQARALARVSAYGPVNAMYPMIVDLQQFLALKEMFLAGISDLPAPNLKHGIMFEVPSACLEAPQILEVADFASIGTNDLIQYMFAVDRDNELVAYDYDPEKPIFWSLIGNMVRAADQAGRPLSVCGEAVGNPKLLKKFMDTGIRTISVSPRLIPELRLSVNKQRQK